MVEEEGDEDLVRMQGEGGEAEEVGDRLDEGGEEGGRGEEWVEHGWRLGSGGRWVEGSCYIKMGA